MRERIWATCMHQRLAVAAGRGVEVDVAGRKTSPSMLPPLLSLSCIQVEQSRRCHCHAYL